MVPEDSPGVIDLYEDRLIRRDWDYARPDDMQLSFELVGAWGAQHITIFEATGTHALRIASGYTMKVKKPHRTYLEYTAPLFINDLNERNWEGAFCWIHKRSLLYWRHEFRLSDDPEFDATLIDHFLSRGVSHMERCIPGLLHLAAGMTLDEALAACVDRPRGRA